MTNDPNLENWKSVPNLLEYLDMSHETVLALWESSPDGELMNKKSPLTRGHRRV